MNALVLLAFCGFVTFAAPALAAGGSFSDLALEPRPGARLPLAAQLIDETLVGLSGLLVADFERAAIIHTPSQVVL